MNLDAEDGLFAILGDLGALVGAFAFSPSVILVTALLEMWLR